MSHLDLITLALAPYSAYLAAAAYAWVALATVGKVALYIGYGFAMAAKNARDLGFSQRKVLYVDGFIAFWFVLLDFALNVLVFSVICLDFRPKQTWTLVTGRLCLYSLDPDERPYRKWVADFLAAFLDGKDPSGDHVKGDNFKFKWLE